MTDARGITRAVAQFLLQEREDRLADGAAERLALWAAGRGEADQVPATVEHAADLALLLAHRKRQARRFEELATAAHQAGTGTAVPGERLAGALDLLLDELHGNLLEQRPARLRMVERYGVAASQAVLAAHGIEAQFGPLLAEGLGQDAAARHRAFLRSLVAAALEAGELDAEDARRPELYEPADPAAPPAPPLPHDSYVHAVSGEFRRWGIPVVKTWTDVTDDPDLIAGIEFDPEYASRATWPGGVFLGWDQHRGWALLASDNRRPAQDLTVSRYASPAAVAHAAQRVLAGEGPGVVCETWTAAVATEAAVTAWLAAEGHAAVPA